MRTGFWLVAALASVAGTARAHEGETQRILRASARVTADGQLALDVLVALSLARTASMLAIAQLDLNHDGRFDALERAMAEWALGDRPDHDLIVALEGRPVRPAERSIAVQLDAQGKHVSVAVLSTFAAPGPARFAVSLGDADAVPPLVVSPGADVRLDGAGVPITCSALGAACAFTVSRAVP